MRAVVLIDDGIRKSEVKNVDDPIPSQGEALMAVSGATINRVDIYLKEDGRGVRAKLPQVMGLDGIGKIVQAPANSELVPGDRVALYPVAYCGKCHYCQAGEQALCLKAEIPGENRDGSFAEYICMPAKCFIKIPEELSVTVATAGLSISYLTAYKMIFGEAPLLPNQSILIQGIGGGVSVACLQLALLVGAQVWVTSSDDSKLEKACQIGAAGGFNYKTEDIVTGILKATNGLGVDRVIDSSGADSWSTSLRSARRGGRIIICGATTGGNPPADLQRIFIRQLTIQGSSLCNLSEFQELIKLLSERKFVPIIDSIYELANIDLGFKKISKGLQFGKLVITL